MLVVHLPADGEAVLYPKGPAHQPATLTVLNFVVSDVPAAVAELTGRGVSFERYDGTPMQTDADGVEGASRLQLQHREGAVGGG